VAQLRGKTCRSEPDGSSCGEQDWLAASTGGADRVDVLVIVVVRG